jgi:phage tail-like protein
MSSAQHLPALLPAIYREDDFLARYLWAFEQVLLQLEHRIDRIADLFNPNAKAERPEFLPWLASWMAFTVRADLDENTLRSFIAKVIPLYRHRGTKANLQQLLFIFTGLEPTVTENVKEGADAPFYFEVKISIDGHDTVAVQRQSAIARALIELEKPAHTHFGLIVDHPSMQIGFFSHVGQDTLLGDRQPDPVSHTAFRGSDSP